MGKDREWKVSKWEGREGKMGAGREGKAKGKKREGEGRMVKGRERKGVGKEKGIGGNEKRERGETSRKTAENRDFYQMF